MEQDGTGAVVVRYGLELTDERHPQMIREQAYQTETDTFTNPKDIDAFFRKALELDRQYEEHLFLMCLNLKGRIQGLFELSHGTMAMTPCGMKELAVRLLLSGCSNCILVHNHPSGKMEPSLEDERMADRVSEVASLLDIKLLDFIIIGDGYFSFCEHRKME